MSNVSQTSGRSSPARTRKPGSGMLALLLTFALAISGCAFKSPLVVQPNPIHLEDPPPELMEPEQPNLRQRLQQLSGPSPLTVTAPSGNSEPSKTGPKAQ